LEKQALAGYLTGSGLAGAAGFVYMMEKAAGDESELTQTLDELVKEASVNEKKASLTAQLLMSEVPEAMDIERSSLLKAASYVEAVHGAEPQENRVAILKDMVKRANEIHAASYQEDIEKSAGFMNMAMPALAPMAMAVSVGSGMYGASRLVGGAKNAIQYRKFTGVFDYVVRHNEVLKHQYAENPKKVRSFAETIFDFAPSVAMDPNLLSTVLANAVMGDSMDPMTINSLAQLQSNHNKGMEEGLPFAGTNKITPQLPLAARGSRA
jgi:hypothetical protein